MCDLRPLVRHETVTKQVIVTGTFLICKRHCLIDHSREALQVLNKHRNGLVV